MGAMLNNSGSKKRLTELDRMTPEQKAGEAIKYWAAPDDAMFSPVVIAIVYKLSLSWLQQRRCTGTGIKYFKPDPKSRTVLYKKSDAIQYFSQRECRNTSS